METNQINKGKIFTYAVLFDIVRSSIQNAMPDLTPKNETSIFNAIVTTLKNHKDKQDA
jgi:hypothetical protein